MGQLIYWSTIPVSVYLLKVNNKNTKTWCEICSKLTIGTPQRRQWRYSGVFIVNFKHEIDGWDIYETQISRAFVV